MKKANFFVLPFTFCAISLMLGACSQYGGTSSQMAMKQGGGESSGWAPNYASRMPSHISTGEKTVIVDPNVHAWGAYDAKGNLVKAGQATAGGNWCPDIKRSCRTHSGTFRVYSLGSANCKSSKYPLPRGGAPMPYCMYFNGSQGLHGSPSGAVIDGNASHGCVRMHVGDAEWLRYNFVNVGTRVVVKPY